MNDVPGARQSRDPACAAAQVESRTLRHAKSSCLLTRAFFATKCALRHVKCASLGRSTNFTAMGDSSTKNRPIRMNESVLVRERRLELPRRLTHAPQTCLSTCSSTLAYPFSRARVIIAEKWRMSRTNFKFSCLLCIQGRICGRNQQSNEH